MYSDMKKIVMLVPRDNFDGEKERRNYLIRQMATQIKVVLVPR